MNFFLWSSYNFLSRCENLGNLKLFFTIQVFYDYCPFYRKSNKDLVVDKNTAFFKKYTSNIEVSVGVGPPGHAQHCIFELDEN